jgi:hypothetical protein
VTVSYRYWAVRFVPDPARGEFTNVGIIAGADDADWAVSLDPRFVRNHGDFSSDLRELAPWRRAVTRAVDSHANTGLGQGSTMSSAVLEHMRRRQSNVIQFAAPLPVVASTAEEAVRLLYPVLVERQGSGRGAALTRRGLRAQVRHSFERRAGFIVGHDLFVEPGFTVGRQHGDFDLARAARDSLVLTNVWAFNVRTLTRLERDLQSWSYLVGRIRDDGARLDLPGEAGRVIRADVPIEVFYDAPDTRLVDARRSDIFDAALEAWSRDGLSVSSWSEHLEHEAEAARLVGA